MKIGFISLGCAKNLTDTESMIGILDGYTITPKIDDADIIVINTCAFIDSAKEESIEAILEAAQYKNKNCKCLVVTGCLSQRYKDEIFELMDEVDIILGTNDYIKIKDAIDEFFKTNKKVMKISSENAHIEEDVKRVISTPKHMAYLKIADGCDNFCTYCIIPKLRGKFKSRSEKSIIEEAKRLSNDGAKEIILVAQDTAYYGKDEGEYKLSKLLKEISKIDKIKWIRLQYCYPENITDDLIDEIANNKKVVKYLDMPLQHVSDNVLKLMGRKSREDEIYSLIEKLRKKIPDIVIRTSIIVGFPKETEEDFNRLSTFLQKVRLDKVGVFTYSKEEGTPAYNFDGQIDEDIKQARYDKLMTIQRDVSLNNNKEKIGKTVEVIIEDYDFEEFCYVGRTYGDTPDVDAKAYVYSEDELKIGSIVKIEILNAYDYDVEGKTVNIWQKGDWFMNLPNKITIARIMLIPFFMFTLLLREIFGPDNAFIMDIISAMLFIIASATDGVDGYIARKNNQVTDFGKFLDPIADKLLVAAALISLVELGRIPAYMVFIILAREFIVTGLRIIAVQNGIVLAAEMTGKIKTVIQIIATVICILFASEKFNLFGISICHIAMGIATLFTIYSGYVYLRNNWKLIANAK